MTGSSWCFIHCVFYFTYLCFKYVPPSQRLTDVIVQYLENPKTINSTATIKTAYRLKVKWQNQWASEEWTKEICCMFLRATEIYQVPSNKASNWVPLTLHRPSPNCSPGLAMTTLSPNFVSPEPVVCVPSDEEPWFLGSSLFSYCRTTAVRGSFLVARYYHRHRRMEHKAEIAMGAKHWEKAN